MNAPKVTYQANQHRYQFMDEGIEVILDRFSEERHGAGVVAEVTVSTSREPGAGLLHRGRVNLISPRSRNDVVRALEKRIPNQDVDMGGIIEVVCYGSLDRWREGDPTVDLRDVKPSERPRWRVEPFMEEAGAALIFGDGGSAKSILGLAIAASGASGQAIIGTVHGEPAPVLYLDWEADKHRHAECLRAICKGAGISETPPVYYRRQVASLVESAVTLRREVAKVGAGFVVIDSMGAARGGDPDSASDTIKMFTAARSLGVPWIGIDHVAKNAQDKSKPFGSAYSHNLARMTWGVDRQQEIGEDQMVIALTNRKANNGRLARRQAFRLRFDMDIDELDAITFDSCDIRDVPELVAKMGAKERILNTLRYGPKTLDAIAAEADCAKDQVTARLADLRRKGHVHQDGKLWGKRE